MASLNLEDMQQIQKELQAKYLENWGGLSPKIGRDKLLWMMIEAGEVADIIKKKGDDAILNDPETRHHFTEEVCDVLMYLMMFCCATALRRMKSRTYISKSTNET